MAQNTPKPSAPKTSDLKALPGISDQVAAINHQIQKVAQTDLPVFITGEPGTEKAFAAKLVHAMSSRAKKPLYKTTISTILPNDFAIRFRQCDGGSLVLNITKRIPEDIQIVLMELTRDKIFQDPMSGEMIEADVRFIITTSLDLEKLMDENELLDDLGKLIKRRHIKIPPLRERPEDIPALVRYASARARDTGRSKVSEGDAQVLALFRQWHWPGNAEDLLLVTAEACLQAKGDKISLEDLSPDFMEQVGEDLVDKAKEVRVSKISPKALDLQPKIFQPPVSEEAGPDKETDHDQPTDHDPITGDPEADEMTVDALRYQRLLKLARRLHSQSEILSKQMSGPLTAFPLDDILQHDTKFDIDSEELSEQLELQLDKSLDSIMGLRRQLALLNEREQKTIETARDLYRRLILAGKDITSVMDDEEIQQETADLAASLQEMDDVIQRVSGSFPKLGAQLENKASSTALGKEEAEFVAKALKRARSGDSSGSKSSAEKSEDDTLTIRDLIKFAKASDENVKKDQADTEQPATDEDKTEQDGDDTTQVPKIN